MPETAETASTEEVATILGIGGRIDVEGIECEVGRLKTREMFSVLRILAQGLGGNVANVFAPGLSADELGGRFMGAMMMSIPQAENDFIVLLKRMVKPVDPDDEAALKKKLDNPELETLLTVAETMVMQEAGELARLGKAAQSWWEMNKSQIQAQMKRD